MSDEYFDSEDFREILEQYERATAEGRSIFMDVDDLADIADYYHMNGRTDEADEVIELTLALHPGATPPLVYKIHAALDDNDLEAALDYQQQIMDKGDLEYTFISAELLIAQNRIDEADALFSEAFRNIMPDEHQDFVVDVANLYSDYDVHDKAMEWMMRGKPEDTDDFKELVARTMFGLGKYDESERLFNELIDHNPFEKHYWNALASAQYMKEDYQGSIASSEYAIAIDPDDPEGIMAKANGLFRLENYPDALEYFARYSEHVPDDPVGWLHQGTCLINMAHYEEAAKKLHQALECTSEADEDNLVLADIYQELGFAYGEMGRPETAIYYLDKTDELDCDHHEMNVVKGHVLLSNGRMEEAEAKFREAIDNAPNTNHILLRVLVSIYDNKYVQAAYKMLKKYVSLIDDCTEGYSYLALSCWDLGLTDEFMGHLKTAIERNPREARQVLGYLFPEGMKPEDYYHYAKENLKKQ